MVCMFGVGVGIERVALRRLAGRPIIMILMMTLGLDIFVRAAAMTIWGGTARPLPLGISDAPLIGGQVDATIGGSEVRLGGDVIVKVNGHEAGEVKAIGQYLDALKEGDQV